MVSTEHCECGDGPCTCNSTEHEKEHHLLAQTECRPAFCKVENKSEASDCFTTDAVAKLNNVNVCLGNSGGLCNSGSSLTTFGRDVCAE